MPGGAGDHLVLPLSTDRMRWACSAVSGGAGGVDEALDRGAVGVNEVAVFTQPGFGLVGVEYVPALIEPVGGKALGLGEVLNARLRDAGELA